jgi:hypothetical protein
MGANSDEEIAMTAEQMMEVRGVGGPGAGSRALRNVGRE